MPSDLTASTMVLGLSDEVKEILVTFDNLPAVGGPQTRATKSTWRSWPGVQRRLSSGLTRFSGRLRSRQGINSLAGSKRGRKSSKYTQLIFFDQPGGYRACKKTI